MSVAVRRVTTADVLPLRQLVLRPGLPPDASRYPDDDAAVHVGAWDGDRLVGCGTVFPEPWEDAPAAWRLRGMAVAPDRRGSGVGAQVLAALVVAACSGGAELIWANARSTALGFYERQGWRVAGAEFTTADTGLPHFPIVRECPKN